MKVVATRSFFGSGISVKRGVVIEVSDKLAKAWLKAGLATKADDKAKTAVATTSPTKAPATSQEDATDTTGEVVDDENNPNADGSNDSEQTTLDDAEVVTDQTDADEVKTDDPETVVLPPSETTAPVEKTVVNSNQNTKKGSK